FAELNLKIADQSKPNYSKKLNIFNGVHSQAECLYAKNLRVIASSPFRDSQYHLYAIEFPDSYSYFGDSLDPSLRIGFLTQAKLPSAQIDSLMYLNQNQLRVKISLIQSCEMAPYGLMLDYVKFFHNHVIQDVL